MKFWNACLILTLTGCASAPVFAPSQTPRVANNIQTQSNPSAAVADIYPVAPGNRWVYTLSQRQDDKPNTKFKTMHMWTEALANDGNVQQAVLRRGYPDSQVTPKPTLARIYGDRVELSRYEEPTITDLHLPRELQAQSPEGQNFVTIIKSPFEVGHHWEGRLFKGGTETIKVMGWETVTVPAGTFRALKVEHHKQYQNNKEDFLYYWYAPRVGMVKLYEELTFYYGKWIKFQSTGELQSHSRP